MLNKTQTLKKYSHEHVTLKCCIRKQSVQSLLQLYCSRHITVTIKSGSRMRGFSNLETQDTAVKSRFMVKKRMQD